MLGAASWLDVRPTFGPRNLRRLEAKADEVEASSAKRRRGLSPGLRRRGSRFSSRVVFTACRHISDFRSEPADLSRQVLIEDLNPSLFINGDRVGRYASEETAEPV